VKHPNLIPNADFQQGAVGSVPQGWHVVAYRPSLAPVFKLVRKDGQKVLLATGGAADCVGYLATTVPITLGKTYRFRVSFTMSPDLDPNRSLLFQCYGPGANSGIHEFVRLPDGSAQGEARITYTGEGAGQAEVRILLRLSDRGKAWISHVSLTECEPLPPHWVRVACTSGPTNLQSCEAVLDACGQAKVDLIVLPEYMAGCKHPEGDRIEEPLRGPSCKLMAAKAKQYGMYVAGGIVRRDEAADRVYNTALLLDRKGRLVGTYDKLHPYSPEINDQGISPGREVPVFRTDLGVVGFIICYDSWFTDVTELVALKGAQLVMFPNAGCYRALLHARAADNRVRIVCSSWNSGYGVWDTVGRDLVHPEQDQSHGNPPGLTYRDPVETKVGDVGLFMVSLDMNCAPSPHYNGGTMFEAPGGTRNRRDTGTWLEEQIMRERRRWWTNE